MQPNNKPTPNQEVFEAFIAEQPSAIQDAYEQIKSEIHWLGYSRLFCVLPSIKQTGKDGFVQKVAGAYCEYQTQQAQAKFEQLIAKQSDELRVYYAQLKATHKIKWQYPNQVENVLEQVIADNNLAFIKLFLTQYDWAQYYNSTPCGILRELIKYNYQEIIAFFLGEFHWHNCASDFLMRDMTDLLETVLLDMKDNDHHDFPKEACIQVVDFFISKFVHNPKIFGYGSTNDLVADFRKFFILDPAATKALIVRCGELNTVAARDFLRLLADNINNMGHYSVEELQKLCAIINETLIAIEQTAKLKSVIMQQQSLQQTPKTAQAIGNQKGIGIVHAMKQLERIIFNLLSANEASPAIREQLLGQFLVTHAAILKQCLDQYSASHQNFATNPAALESIIARSQETGEPQFIVLDSCAAFNPDSRAILIVTPRAANQEQAWYFSPVGAAMPAAVQEVIGRRQLQVNIINNAAVLPNQVATAMAAPQKPGQQ